MPAASAALLVVAVVVVVVVAGSMAYGSNREMIRPFSSLDRIS